MLTWKVLNEHEKHLKRLTYQPYYKVKWSSIQPYPTKQSTKDKPVNSVFTGVYPTRTGPF